MSQCQILIESNPIWITQKDLNLGYNTHFPRFLALNDEMIFPRTQSMVKIHSSAFDANDENAVSVHNSIKLSVWCTGESNQHTKRLHCDLQLTLMYKCPIWYSWNIYIYLGFGLHQQTVPNCLLQEHKFERNICAISCASDFFGSSIITLSNSNSSFLISCDACGHVDKSSHHRFVNANKLLHSIMLWAIPFCGASLYVAVGVCWSHCCVMLACWLSLGLV